MTDSRDPARAVYVISVAAEIAGVHAQTLRVYEQKGLIDPARTSGGSRRYSDLDIDQIRRVTELTDAGLNLAGVKRVLELEAEVGALRAQLDQTREAARRAVEAAHRQHRRDLVPLNQDLLPWASRHPRREV